MTRPFAIQSACPTRNTDSRLSLVSHEFTLGSISWAAPTHRDVLMSRRHPAPPRECHNFQSTNLIQVTFSFPSPFVQNTLLDFLTTALDALPICSAGARHLSSPAARHARDEHDCEVHVCGSPSE